MRSPPLADAEPSMRMRLTASSLALLLGLVAPNRGTAGEKPQTEPPRLVLVELYTSQGCDMCPEAERQLGVLAEGNPRVVPVAFHVDYFNDPWKDPFSDSLHSQRQAAYNGLYNKPKHPDYGLYYTPMVMIDGLRSENGRDLPAVKAAVREASARRALVRVEAKFAGGDRDSAGKLEIRLASRSPRVQGRELLICAVLRDDRVVTAVRSGENANRTLTSRFPARETRFEFVTLSPPGEKTLSFSFRPEPGWKPDRLGLVVFAQDRQSGEIYGTAYVPWQAVPGK